MNQILFRSMLFVAFVKLMPASVEAQLILVGCTGNGTANSTSQLVDIDIATGSVSNSRDIGIRVMSGIATQPGTGLLFGLTSFASNPANTLLRIDMVTGLPTIVGPTGLPFIVEGDIAFNPLDGLLYGIQDIGTNGTQSNLFTINPNNGTGVVVGNTNSPGDLSALAFGPTGVLYSIDSSGMQNSRLLTINPANGQILGNIAMNVNLGPVVGMTFDPQTGIAYVADCAPSLASGGTNSLYLLDPFSGLTTLVGPTNDPNGIAGLAFTTVPEPSSFLLAGGAYFAFRMFRRKKSVLI